MIDTDNIAACDGCQDEIKHSDNCYCESCHSDLNRQIDNLEGKIEDLEDEIRALQGE